jgi:hypothetical protein
MVRAARLACPVLEAINGLPRRRRNILGCQTDALTTRIDDGKGVVAPRVELEPRAMSICGIRSTSTEWHESLRDLGRVTLKYN